MNVALTRDIPEFPGLDVPKHLSVGRLMLTDFRSYGALRLALDARPVVLAGPNGAGKTNILEALSYLSPGRGLRAARLPEIAREEPDASSEMQRADAWAVSADVQSPSGTTGVGTGWSAGSDQGGAREVRKVKLEGQPAASQASLAEHVWMAWLTPAMDRLFVEAPAGRRRFLDRLIFGLDPAHNGRLQRYDHARRERARLLREGAGDPSWLSALEQNMAETAVAIAAARRDLVERLGDTLRCGGDSFPRPEIAVCGLVEDWLEGVPALDVEERYRAQLLADRPADAESGSCEGIHRSDLAAWLRAGGTPAERASTGQQKAILIAIVLAHARLLARLRGAAPILLLDEVVAHLDAERRAALFAAILDIGAQAWLTGTDRSLFTPLGEAAQFYAVNAATVAEEGPRG